MTEDIKENRNKSNAKMAAGKYDVFLSYNHKDEKRVKEIGGLLIDNGIAPWFDEWDLQPGLPWQSELEKQIGKTPSAAIFVGPAGLGDWHQIEQQAFLKESVRRGCLVIPVFLSDAPPDAAFSPFLGNNTWVDFRKKDPDPLEHLIWGITRRKPEKVYRPGILIASLGDSPVVVSSMYDLLVKEEKLTIDHATILAPKDENVQLAYKQVQETLTDVRELRYEELDFKDADSWHNACVLLRRLYKLLDHYQKQGDSVYLSLAGGRKSMAALMAWVVPFFPCVKKLYHVIDKKEEKFLSSCEIHDRPASEFSQLMHPDPRQLKLVEIPFNPGQQVSEKFLRQLLSSSADFDKAEALITAQTIFQEENILQVEVTEQVIEQFRKLCKKNSADARVVRNGLLEMSQIATLRAHETGAASYPYKPAKSSRIALHSFTGLQVPIHPVFYTQPEDVYASPDSKVERIVICSLETEGADGYRSFKEIATSPNFSHKGYSSVDELPPAPSPADSVLIVPLGKSPMIATQLYTLLTMQEERTIHEVVLIYPALSVEIRNGAQIIEKVLKEKSVHCRIVGVPDLDDIASSDACQIYQTCVEEEIGHIQKKYPKYKIDLALSGGRKGMTAMTLFAAQNCRIPYVYHTLITNENLSEQIDEETTITELNKISKQDRDKRLFLDAYRDDDQYSHFALFRIPVFTADGW